MLTRAAIVCVFAIAGCGRFGFAAHVIDDAGSADAMIPDAVVPDAARPDAAVPDAVVPDAMETDAEAADGDASSDDADVPDAMEMPDADVPDAMEMPDADVPDAMEMPDADVPDADVPDADVPDASASESCNFVDDDSDSLVDEGVFRASTSFTGVPMTGQNVRAAHSPDRDELGVAWMRTGSGFGVEIASFRAEGTLSLTPTNVFDAPDYVYNDIAWDGSQWLVLYSITSGTPIGLYSVRVDPVSGVVSAPQLIEAKVPFTFAPSEVRLASIKSGDHTFVAAVWIVGAGTVGNPSYVRSALFEDGGLVPGSISDVHVSTRRFSDPWAIAVGDRFGFVYVEQDGSTGEIHYRSRELDGAYTAPATTHLLDGDIEGALRVAYDAFHDRVVVGYVDGTVQSIGVMPSDGSTFTGTPLETDVVSVYTVAPDGRGGYLAFYIASGALKIGRYDASLVPYPARIMPADLASTLFSPVLPSGNVAAISNGSGSLVYRVYGCVP